MLKLTIFVAEKLSHNKTMNRKLKFHAIRSQGLSVKTYILFSIFQFSCECIKLNNFSSKLN